MSAQLPTHTLYPHWSCPWSFNCINVGVGSSIANPMEKQIGCYNWPIIWYIYLWLTIDISMLNIYVFKEKKIDNFKLNFQGFQKSENRYAKYMLYCVFVIITQWTLIFNNFDKYQWN